MTVKTPWMSSLPGLHQRFVEGEHGKFHVETLQDVETIIERNKELKTIDDGFNATRTGRRVASIPIVLWYKWLREEGVDVFAPGNEEALKRKLRDPDYRHLRTSEGGI